MSIDKFGRSVKSANNKDIHNLFHLQQQQQQQVPSTTKDGDFDFDNHKICNLKDPTNDQDAATRRYVKLVVENMRKELLYTIDVKLKHLISTNVQSNRIYKESKTEKRQ